MAKKDFFKKTKKQTAIDTNTNLHILEQAKKEKIKELNDRTQQFLKNLNKEIQFKEEVEKIKKEAKDDIKKISVKSDTGNLIKKQVLEIIQKVDVENPEQLEEVEETNKLLKDILKQNKNMFNKDEYKKLETLLEENTEFIKSIKKENKKLNKVMSGSMNMVEKSAMVLGGILDSPLLMMAGSKISDYMQKRSEKKKETKEKKKSLEKEIYKNFKKEIETKEKKKETVKKEDIKEKVDNTTELQNLIENVTEKQIENLEQDDDYKKLEDEILGESDISDLEELNPKFNSIQEQIDNMLGLNKDYDEKAEQIQEKQISNQDENTNILLRIENVLIDIQKDVKSILETLQKKSESDVFAEQKQEKQEELQEEIVEGLENLKVKEKDKDDDEDKGLLDFLGDSKGFLTGGALVSAVSTLASAAVTLGAIISVANGFLKAYKGWKNPEKVLGYKKEEYSVLEKLSASLSKFVEGLTFGLVKGKSWFKFWEKVGEYFYDYIISPLEKLFNFIIQPFKRGIDILLNPMKAIDNEFNKLKELTDYIISLPEKMFDWISEKSGEMFSKLGDIFKDLFKNILIKVIDVLPFSEKIKKSLGLQENTISTNTIETNKNVVRQTTQKAMVIENKSLENKEKENKQSNVNTNVVNSVVNNQSVLLPDDYNTNLDDISYLHFNQKLNYGIK